MSKLTPTNEETLIGMLKKLEIGHHLVLEPSHEDEMSWIEVYEIPLDVDFSYLGPEKKKGYFKCAFMGLALHSDVWQIRGDASKYR